MSFRSNDELHQNKSNSSLRSVKKYVDTLDKYFKDNSRYLHIFNCSYILRIKDFF